jgi:hypothetical protein
VKFQGDTEGNISIDDLQQKHFISYLLVEFKAFEGDRGRGLVDVGLVETAVEIKKGRNC